MDHDRPKYLSIRDLLVADSQSALEDSDLDDQLWLLLCDRVRNPNDLAALPPAVAIYYASRLVQWEVGNGGFSQAASNVAEWFPHAASAYDALGRSDFASLIRDAMALTPADHDELEGVEEEFDELDRSLPNIEWEIDETRVAYVRQHRDNFLVLNGAAPAA